MSWTYRIGKSVPPAELIGSLGKPYYGLCEVYTDSDGRITQWTENTMRPGGESIEELKRDIEYMVAALSKPPLDLNALERKLRRKEPLPILAELDARGGA